MNNSLVSIIIPCFNHSKYLAKTLDSCLQQTYSNLEIIVVNDGSKDHSLDIIKSYASKYENIKYFSIENQGQCAARNLGLEAAKGEFIKFLDADDLLVSYFIERQVQCLQKFSVDIAISAATGFWDQEEIELYSQLNQDFTYSLIGNTETTSFFNLVTNRCFTFNEILIPKNFLSEVGGFNPNLKAAEEINLYLKLLTKFPHLQGFYDDNLRLLKRLNHGSLAHVMREQKERNWLLESLYDAARYYLTHESEDSFEIKKYIFGRLYVTSTYAYRNGLKELANNSIDLWNQSKLPYPDIQPNYHKILHNLMGFRKAEEFLMLMRKMRDLLNLKNIK